MGGDFSDAQSKFDDLSKPSGKLGNPVFDSVFGEFITFFNNLLVGEQSNTEDEDNRCAGAIASTNSIDMAQRSVIDIFNENEEKIKTDTATYQEITINCGDEPLDGFYLEKQYEYDIFGNKKEPGCIKYGCCYDIEQIATNNVQSVNSSITNESSKMFNDIKASLQSDVNIEVGGKCDIGVLDQAISESETDSIVKINQILADSISTTADLNQNVIVKSHHPLRCVNTCDEPPSAGTIKQSINVDIHSENIVTSSFDSVITNYKRISSDTKLSVTAIPTVKLYLFSIMSLIFIAIIYFLIFFMCKFLYKYAKKSAETALAVPTAGMSVVVGEALPESTLILHVMTIIMHCILYPMYMSSVCAYRTDMKDLTCYLD